MDILTLAPPADDPFSHALSSILLKIAKTEESATHARKAPNYHLCILQTQVHDIELDLHQVRVDRTSSRMTINPWADHEVMQAQGSNSLNSTPLLRNRWIGMELLFHSTMTDCLSLHPGAKS